MGTVKTANTARQALVRQKYFPDRESITLERLPLILLQISAASKIPAPEIESMRAVALVMEEMLRERSAEELVRAVMDRLNPSLEDMRSSGRMIVASSEEVRDSTTSLANTVEEHRVDCQNITHEITAAAYAVEASTKQMDSILDQALKESPSLFNYKDPVPFKPADDPNIHRSHHAHNTVNTNNIPTEHASAIARFEEKARQVLLTPTADNESLGLSEMEPHELVQKANLAIENVIKVHPLDERETTPKAMGAQLRRNGDLLLHMSTKEAATWVLSESVRDEFITHFSSKAELKDRRHQVIVEFVPTAFNPDSFFEIVELTTVNNIPHDSILDARWIRPIEARKKDQKVAHIILSFKSPVIANKAISQGLFIKGKRTEPRKLLPDPKRCFKCHKYDVNHLAKDCKQIHEWCDICGETNHDGRTCPNKDGNPHTFHCIPCNMKGHSTRNRACPTFRNEYARLAAKVTDAQYRYFVTDEPASWELLNPYSFKEDNGTLTQVTNRGKRTTADPPTIAPPPTIREQRSGTNTVPLGNNRTRATRQGNLDNFLSQGQTNNDPKGPPARRRAFSRSWTDDYDHDDVTP